MGFKESKKFEEHKGNFTNEMAKFVSHEAGQFQSEGNEAASANVDAAFEKAVQISSQKNQTKAKEYQNERKELSAQKKFIAKQEKMESQINKRDGVSNINPSNQVKIQAIQAQNTRFIELSKEKEQFQKTTSKETKEYKESSRFTDQKDRQQNTAQKKKELKKKEHKEKKKQATKISVGRILSSKKDISNELAGGGANTGDAFHDGWSGLVGSILEVINPMHYFKAWLAKIGALLAPYILLFMTVAIVLVVVVALMFEVMQPLVAVGNAINSFLSIFSSDDDTFSYDTLSDDEIDQIVADSGCDSTQEEVLRYALSKVGYPYSQENRTSGDAYDCSSLAYYAWKDAGIDISGGYDYPPSAAAGAEKLNSTGKCIASDDVDSFSLSPGDLVFYGGSDNGRYLGIYHVAVYVGNGKAVEALNTEYGVVYQTLRTNNAIMVCRPNK